MIFCIICNIFSPEMLGAGRLVCLLYSVCSPIGDLPCFPFWDLPCSLLRDWPRLLPWDLVLSFSYLECACSNSYMYNITRISIKSKIIKEMSTLILRPYHLLMTSFLCLKYSVKFKIVFKQGNCELMAMLNEIYSCLLITHSFEW